MVSSIAASALDLKAFNRETSMEEITSWSIFLTTNFDRLKPTRRFVVCISDMNSSDYLDDMHPRFQRGPWERGWTTCCCKRADANSLRKQGVLRVTSVNNSSSAKCAFSICLGVKSWGEHIRACHCLLVDCA